MTVVIVGVVVAAALVGSCMVLLRLRRRQGQRG